MVLLWKKQFKRIIHHNVKQNHYNASLCLVWCFDDRFSNLLDNFKRKLNKTNNITHLDIIKVAGGAKCLTNGPTYIRRTIIENIAISVKLHRCREIGLMVHSDCGAYNRKFAGDKEERRFYGLELRKAKNNLESFFLKEGITIPIKLYYADFEGLYELKKG